MATPFQARTTRKMMADQKMAERGMAATSQKVEWGARRSIRSANGTAGEDRMQLTIQIPCSARDHGGSDSQSIGRTRKRDIITPSTMAARMAKEILA